MVSSILGTATPSIWQPHAPQQKNRDSFGALIDQADSTMSQGAGVGSPQLSGQIQNLLMQMQESAKG